MILFLSTLYTALVVLSPVFNAKIVDIHGWTFLAFTPISIFTIAIIDTLTNQWGRKVSRRTITNALIIRAFIYLGLFPILFLLPDAGKENFDGLLHQSFRNFLVSESTTFVTRYWVEIPLFAWLGRYQWHFILKHAFANSVFLVLKGASKTFLMYVGVAGVNMWALMLGDIVAKLGTLIVGAPFAAGVNKLVGWIKARRPEWV